MTTPMHYPKGTFFIMRDPKNGEIMHAGEVQSAHNYGTPERPDWFVEFNCVFCETNTPGAHYLKQQYDGYANVVMEFRDSLIVGPEIKTKKDEEE